MPNKFYEELAEIARTATYTKLDKNDWGVTGAAIMFKNFSGTATDVNPIPGKRSFALVLPKEMADILTSEGYNVKQRAIDPDTDDYIYYTEIVVNFDSQWPPRIHMVTVFGGNENVIRITAENAFELDKNQLKDIELIIHPYQHGRSNPSGSTVKGYLRSLNATQVGGNDFIGEKYARFVGSENW